MLDIDLLNHPELVELCHKAVVDEHRQAREDYKDIPLPFARKRILERQIAARKEAIRCYCEKKSIQAHEVMAKTGPQNNDTI